MYWRTMMIPYANGYLENVYYVFIIIDTLRVSSKEGAISSNGRRVD